MAVEKNIIVHKLIDSENKSSRQRFFALFLMSFSVLFLCGGSLKAQRRLEMGPLAGVSYYMGDLNQGVPFVEPHLSLGGLARYVFNDRIALKGSFLFAGLSGSYDSDKDGILPTYGRVNGTPETFSRNVVSLSVSGEINLFSYDHKYISTTVFTPYLSAGFGSMGYNRLVQTGDSITSKPYFALSLPLGLGVKYKFSKWLRVGAEWTFFKLFVDDVDNYDTLGNVVTHNNDWFSVIDIYITFGFFKRNSSCQGGY